MVWKPLLYFGNNTLKDVYQYEPVQKNCARICFVTDGRTGTLWTEFCNRPEDVDYLVFPVWQHLPKWDDARSRKTGLRF